MEFMFAGMTWYEIFGYFLVYSFIGWMVEVAYHAVTQGKVINRGFLAGPVCPVYGFGMLVVFGVIDLISGTTVSRIGEANAVVIFFAGMVLASAVEFIGGWGLYHAFHARWWDYSDKPFNLGGYVCLEFSIYWGIGALLVIRILQPVVERFSVGLIPQRWGWPLMAFLYAVYCADSVVTILIVLGLNKHLAELDELREYMRLVSDDLSERIGTQTLESMQRLDETRVQAALAKAEMRDAVEEKREQREKEIARRKVEYARRREAWEKEAARIRETLETENARRREAWEEAGNRRREAMEARAGELRKALEKGRMFGPRRLLKAFPKLSFDSDAFQAILQDIREEIEADDSTRPQTGTKQ